MVGDGGGDVEQVNHYYPYGGLIGNLSTNPDKQKYKYNGKEYDTMNGLNTYDYGARQDGYYDVSWRADKGRGSIPKHYQLENGGPINTYDGNRYEGGYSKYQKNGIFIHRTNMNGTAGDGLHPVSLGCLLIKAQQWKSFENHVGRNPYKIILRRKCGK